MLSHSLTSSLARNANSPGKEERKEERGGGGERRLEKAHMIISNIQVDLDGARRKENVNVMRLPIEWGMP